MKNNILRFLIFYVVSLFAPCAMAQYTITFEAEVTEENPDEALYQRINNSVSDLLTAFGVAHEKKVKINFDGLSVSNEAKNNILRLWDDCPFVCMDDIYVEEVKPVHKREFQIRNINLVMKPQPGRHTKGDWKKYQQAVITLDSMGVVTNFHLAVDASLYSRMMNVARTVEDVEQRMMILEYVERFRNAYNMKDMPFLQQVYSDDALIITGRVVKKQPPKDAKKIEVKSENKNKEVAFIEYKQQTKKEYLTNLQKVFDKNEHINIGFTEIEVKKHPAKQNFYGVTLRQRYVSDTYSDDGWLFLLWDFTDPNKPLVHVRTWQPHKTPNGILPKNDVFSVEDFEL